ncbi:CCCH zinc finger and RRM domain protein [Penicillium brasilianum]|uniref:CCCH zinc finger and RRM domain protein n=1 Tax=Penicillium brasilianum TaxID=104259 RepID=A0A1S9RXV4_PENBI|nr:CCCH zinc finger and RRM domain protein [Penicillium brasilianum]
MHFTDAEAENVKTWVVKRLEDISDADSDVLADYVLALISTDAPDDEIKQTSVENLEDFLRENTQPFVDELFTKFGPQPAAPVAAPQPQPIPTPQAHPSYDAPAGPKTDFYNRKRTYNEGFQGDEDAGNGVPQNRAFKTPRRGRGGGRGDWPGHGAQQYPQGQPGGFPNPMMQGFPPFDPNDPMAAAMMMQGMQGMGFPQMPGMPMPGMPGMPGAAGQPGAGQMGSINQRCPFYDTQGICYLGATCPYQHGEAGSQNEYDPKAASSGTHRGDYGSSRGDRGRGRGRGGPNARGRGGRSDFSSAGPNEDQSITTIVVEQIPDDKLSEEAVREFFSQFGNIVEVTLQSYKKLALVKFETFAEAKQAWSSPKVIFDNRFVKVYWHKPRRDEKNGDSQHETPAFNQEEFEKQQAEAQRAHEERTRKRREADEAKQALERQRDELLKKHQEEKARLLQRIGGGGASDEMIVTPDDARDNSGVTAATSDENVSEETKKLRAQLAALEAEAKTLGIDPSNADSTRGGSRGRGGYRGRGTYRGRGGFDPSYRGGYRGRGGFSPRGRGGSVLRLDNRPRRVAVAGIEIGSDNDEALRQHLIGIGEYESVEPNPEQPGSVIVAFKERYQAEKFMFSRWNAPSAGEVQKSWVPNPPITITPTTTPTEKNGLGDDDQDMSMDTTPVPQAPAPGSMPQREMDYDVAEEDSWGA